MRILGNALKRHLWGSFAILVFLLPGISSANDNPLIAPGKLLIANEALNDPNFDSTVVFIVGHNTLGTLGLIINRPQKNEPPSPLPPRYRALPSNDVVYFGGPVKVESLRALATSRFTIDHAIHVTGELYFLDNTQSIADLMENGPEAESRSNTINTIRVYRGISSWIPGQLEAEIRAGAWYVQNGSEDIVFSDNQHLWEQLISEIHSQWVQLKDSVIPLPDAALTSYNEPDTGHFVEK